MHRTCKLDVEATYSAVACDIRARRAGRSFDFRLPTGLFPNVAKFQALRGWFQQPVPLQWRNESLKVNSVEKREL